MGDALRGASRHALETRGADQLAAALRRGCWIYGAGGYGRLVGRLLGEQDFEVRGFVDRRAGDASVAASLATRVVDPGRFSATDAAGCTLIVAVHNFAADQAPVVAWGRAAGFAEIVIPAELPDILGSEAASYWLTGRSHAAQHIDEIEHLAGLLADPKSVDVLMAAARFRMTGDIAAHPPSHLPSQYFPTDVPALTEPLRLVDGGAYTGDMYDAALRSGASFDEWYAFEPDPVNFALLAETAARARAPRTALFPCGLGRTCGQIRFASGNAAGSHADGAGDSVAQIVALDEVLPGLDPNSVKLDIEGFEREAIAGMRETLVRSQPRVAVSIYHKPEDLWELPFLIRELLPASRLYIRQHGFNGFDTVLYAVP